MFPKRGAPFVFEKNMDANVIIIGGGCAGLQLLYQLLQLPYEQTGDIILIEKQQDFPKKSWCFWAKDDTVYDFLISKSWSKIQFSSTDLNLIQPADPYRYHYINSSDFFQFHDRLISSSDRVKQVKAEVKSMIIEKQMVRVITDQGAFAANMVYDSRIDFQSIVPSANILWQHFRGYFIKTEQAVFDSDIATMMDFSIPQDDAVHFMYVLPFEANRALVEFTAFSAHTYRDEIYDRFLQTYIDQKVPSGYRIIDIESGKIPMTDFDFDSKVMGNILPIGSAAGAIKPTTGYAFHRISKDTRDLMGFFSQSKKIKRGVFAKKRFRFYDKLLLKIIRDEPHRVKQVMEQLFKNNPFRRILQFLDEDSSVLQEVFIFMKLPIRLFLKQVYKYVFSR